MKAVADSSFFLVANGNPDSPPASGLRDYLARHARRLDAVFHPLSPEDPPLHRIVRWERGEVVREYSIHLPSRPPATFLLDVFAPFRRSRADAWIGFSNLSAVHGIARRRVGLTGKVAYWAVDFVPDRFGARSALTRVYDRIDRFAAAHADLRVELTAAARDGRSERLGLPEGGAARTHVAPVGAWLDRIDQAPEDGWRGRRVVFIGHLVPRQGVATLVRALPELPDVHLDIAGRGPEEGNIRALVDELGLADRVRFHGFLSDHRDVERLVASASVAAAPYATDMESFTKYADPSKLRTYTAVGLPIVVTEVPPNAQELARDAGAEVVAYEPSAIADGLRRILSSPEEWQRRRRAAIDYSAAFDWARIVPAALERLGFD
jgi:glycosyltransferase involved in cell wall biosynthesis